MKIRAARQEIDLINRKILWKSFLKQFAWILKNKNKKRQNYRLKRTFETINIQTKWIWSTRLFLIKRLKLFLTKTLTWSMFLSKSIQIRKLRSIKRLSKCNLLSRIQYTKTSIDLKSSLKYWKSSLISLRSQSKYWIHRSRFNFENCLIFFRNYHDRCFIASSTKKLKSF